MSSSTTIGSILDNNKGVGPGFDLLRIVLSLTILCAHCFLIANGRGDVNPVSGPDLASGAVPASTQAIAEHAWGAWEVVKALHSVLVFGHRDTHFDDVLVPMFFALSGFLVTASAFRTKSIKAFFIFRGLRIFPALCTEVSLSALVLGPSLTVLALRDYFSDSKFFEYFGNIVGHVKFELPGLFVGNPFPNMVNFNLWTLPGEFYCYLTIGALMASGLLYGKRTFTAIFAVFAVGFLSFDYLFSASENIHNSWLLVLYFFCGAAFQHWRHELPASKSLFAISLAIIYIHYLSPSRTIGITPLAVTYATVYFGIIAVPKLPLLQSGDYSYGVYLYGFPISQALVHVLGSLRGHPVHLMAVAATLTLGFAVVSWHLIEKPTLALKKRFSPKPVPA